MAVLIGSIKGVTLIAIIRTVNSLVVIRSQWINSLENGILYLKKQYKVEVFMFFIASLVDDMRTFLCTFCT